MQRLKQLFCGLAAVSMAAAVLVLFTPCAQAGDPLVTISGGGTAEFLDEEGEPTGDTTQFSVGAVVDDDGSVVGHFMCMIVHVVTISGVVEDVTLNYDGDGNLESVTLSGTAHGVDHLFPEKPFFGCDFEVELFEGGPDVGGFIYSDCVVTDDTEVVRSGHIMINEH